jgi:hypothetical protein
VLYLQHRTNQHLICGNRTDGPPNPVFACCRSVLRCPGKSSKFGSPRDGKAQDTAYMCLAKEALELSSDTQTLQDSQGTRQFWLFECLTSSQSVLISPSRRCCILYNYLQKLRR